MNIYIACPWKHKDEAKRVKRLAELAGLTVSSRWIDFVPDPLYVYEYPTQIMHDGAMKDIEDLGDSDGMLYLNLAKSEGKATELGYAIAMQSRGLDMPIYVVGGKENNVFLHSDYVKHFATVEDAIVEFAVVHA